jgi:beta-lactamase superfamily II metal-dependent hydrolase
MDFFTLEALPARYGDCLLVHFGSKAKPGLMLVDGGPSRVWPKFLEPRLKALKAARGAGFKIDLMMVSHIDDDHVLGLVDLTGAWKAEKMAGRPWPYPVKEAWFNSFERLSNATDIAAVTASVTASAGAAAVDEIDLEKHGIENSETARAGLKVLASVGNGKELRDDLEALNVPSNTGFAGKLVRPRGGPSVPFKLGTKLRMHVVAPLEDQLKALQRAFAKELKPEAALAAYTDGSVPNLSSIAVVASYQGKTMLLTGDARGDYVRDGLRQEGLLDAAGKLHVDIFKLPHHGSDRNIDVDFFEEITADHYVASADGTFGNPDRATMEMLIKGRGKAAKYAIHLTYPLAEIDARRKEEWETDRAGEIKKKAAKPATNVRRAWNAATDDLAALFNEKKAAGYAFTVAAPAAAGTGARIDLLGALPA